MKIQPIIPIPVAAIVLGLLFLGGVYVVIVKHDDWWKKALSILRILLILGLIFVINLRIMTEHYDMDVELKNTDILFAIDTTVSMWADDYEDGQTRLEGATDACDETIKELTGSSFALVRFDNRSQILAPFTEDATSVSDALTTINQPAKEYARGSNPNVCLEDLKMLLQSSSKKDGRKTILFFISDGEITDGSERQSFAELEKYVDGGAVIGVGSTEGAKMQYKYGDYVKDPNTGKDAVSKLDEENLKAIADDLDVDYIHLESTDNISYLIEAIKAGSTVSMGKSDAVSYDDIYYYYLPFLILLLLFEAGVVIRKKKL